MVVGADDDVVRGGTVCIGPVGGCAVVEVVVGCVVVGGRAVGG